jgi:WD40 repeat protein
MIKNQIQPPPHISRSHGRYLRSSWLVAFVIALASGLAGCQDPGPTDLPAASQTPAVQNSPTPEATLVEATSTPVPTSTPEPTPTFDISIMEDWGAGRLIFDLTEHSFGEVLYRGIYILDLETDQLTEVHPAGTQLLDISPDHKSILIASETELKVFDLGSGSAQTLADNYYSLSPSGARWDHAENQIYYLSAGEAGAALQRVNPASGETEPLATTSTIAVLEADQGIIVLGKGTCNPFGDCAYSEQEWITKEGAQIAIYGIGESVMLPCQIADRYVYAEMSQDGALSLHIRPLDQDQETVFWAVQPEYSDCAWAPDGTRLAVTLVDRFWYSGSIQDYYFQILVPESNQIIDLSYMNTPLDQVAWSPDGEYVAFTGTGLNGESYQIEITLMELNSLSVRKFSQLSEFQSENYLAVPLILFSP